MSLIFTDANFEEEVIKNEGVSLVDFWAPWCGPCQTMIPIIDELSSEIGDKFKIGKVNVDENPAIAQKYSIMSIPTIIIFKNGKMIKSLVGIQSKETLKDDLEKA